MSRLLRVTLCLAAAGAIGGIACSSFSEDDSGTSDAGDADVPTDTSASDGGGASDAFADVAPDATYASPLVSVPVLGAPFFIDATEVTVAQFRAFLLKSGTDAGNPWSACGGKKSLGPNPVCSQGSDDSPVVCVDFCDAQQYCASIGRRVCGAIAGGPLGRGHDTDRTSSQSFYACSGASNTPYAYGTAADATLCNTKESGKNNPAPASAFPKCNGAEPGLLNMNGNVNEWEDACGTDGYCLVRGGTFGSPAAEARCSSSVALAANNTFAGDVGIRCCAGP